MKEEKHFMMELNENNISTILVWIYMIIGPYIASYMNQDQFIVIGTAVFGLILAIWSAYHPNNMNILGNAPCTQGED